MFERKKEEEIAKTELEQTMKQLMDAPGYILFVGYLTEKRDDDDNRIIQFTYRRHNFNEGHLPQAIRAFDNHCLNDMRKG